MAPQNHILQTSIVKEPRDREGGYRNDEKSIHL